MPSWARTASSSSSTSTATREHAQDAHVPNGTLSKSTPNDKGKQKMRMSSSQLSAAAQAPSIASTMANGKAVTHANYNHGESDMRQATITEDEDEADSASSTSEVSPEDAEALLWDAQMALISHQYQTAVSCLTKAAHAGSSTACLSLANIYHKGLPCVTHSHRKHVISPSKLVEGSISVDQTKTAAYTLKALELEADKPSFSDFDLDVLADSSLLLCNMFRYGKIRPRDAARVTGPLKELATTSQMNKSTSFLHPLLEDPDAVQPESAWTRGGRIANLLIHRIEAALLKQGVTWTSPNVEKSITKNAPSTVDDTAIERIDCICICLYYIIALVQGVQEGPNAVEESTHSWRRLLACHSTLKNLHIDNHKLKGGRSGASPTQQLSGSTSAILEGLVSKAEKRLQLLTTAVQEHATHDNSRHPSPRDIVSRRDTSEYSGSSLLSPTSESSINFGSINADSPKQDSPTSYTQPSDKSIDSLCSCILPAPLTVKPVRPARSSEKTPQRKRGAKFALHDSPTSIKSMMPLHSDVLPSSSPRAKPTVPSSLFKGFQSSSRSNLRQSLAGQSMSSSHLSIADMASTASSMAPSTRMRLGNFRRPLLDRRPSQLSLASNSTFGRRAWTSASASPISRVSNLSSASLHTLAPTTDRQMARADVSSLPHATASKSQAHGAARYLSSLKSSTSSQAPASTYSGQFRNALSSLQTFFTPSTLQTHAEEQSKAQAELAKVASEHNAEIENFVNWEDDRTSSEEESLHSGSPSDKAFEDDALSDMQDSAIEGPTQRTEEIPQALPSSLSRSGRTMASTPQRAIYPLSTSISSSYLHSSTPTSSPHRGRRSPLPQAFVDTTSDGAVKSVHRSSEDPASTPKRGDKLLSRTNSPYKPTKIDPLLAALEAASRVNVKSKCAVCGIQEVNFPKCHRCEMTFCSRDCRMASGGEAGKHVCSREES